MSKVIRHYIFCDLCQDQMETEDEQAPPEWVQFVNKRGIDWNVCPECAVSILKATGKKLEAIERSLAGERTETNFPPATTPLPLAVRVDWVCGECEHSLDSHASNGRCGYIFPVPEEDDPFAEVTCPCRVDPAAQDAFFALDAQVRLASIQEQAREVVATEEEQPTTDRRLCRICQHQKSRHEGGAASICAAWGCPCQAFQEPEEPQKVESEPLPNIENEEQLARDFRKVCKWCHHTQAWHAVQSWETCGYEGCRCPLMRDDPMFQGAEETKEEQKPTATEQNNLEERLSDYLVKMADALGISREPFIAIADTLSGKTAPSQKDTLASFEQSLGEARAEVLRETVDQWTAPVFRSCVDCGDPWMWHPGELGWQCQAHECTCLNLRSQEEKFVPEETQS